MGGRSQTLQSPFAPTPKARSGVAAGHCADWLLRIGLSNRGIFQALPRATSESVLPVSPSSRTNGPQRLPPCLSTQPRPNTLLACPSFFLHRVYSSVTSARTSFLRTSCSSRRLSENSDRCEDKSDRVRFFDHLRRIVGLFNDNDRKIRPIRLVRSRSVCSRTGS
jgi:hypothetical protein